MSIPLSSTMSDNVFVHKGGKLEKRKFLAKMQQSAPNCVSNFKIFAGVTPRTPISGEGDIPSQTPPPIGASGLDSWPSATRWSPLTVSYPP